MDKRREELEEQKADLHLAMLMDEYAERMGKQVREDAEAAFERGELEMPAELDAACRAMISDAPDADKKKKPMRAVTRYALVAAAAIVLLFGTLIAVQAAGIDVFGSIATWTDSVFHFRNDKNTTMNEPSAEPENQIQAALRELGMPVGLAPTWLPDGYEITRLESKNTKSLRMVCAFIEKSDFDPLRIVIQENTAAQVVDDEQWEKDYQQIEVYTKNDKAFYIFTNTDLWRGVWFDGRYAIKVYGAQSKEQLLMILDSIGEYEYD